MVLATAAFVALPLPSGCDVPTGVLNSTGVMSDLRKVSMASWAIVGETVIAGADGFGLLVPAKRERRRARRTRNATYLLTQRLPRRPVGCDILTSQLEVWHQLW
jgi:hypothetical protein